MKYGNQVTKEHLPFTKEEVKMFKEYFNGLFEGNPYGIKLAEVRNSNHAIPMLALYFTMPIHNGRDIYHNRIQLRGINFFVFKGKGALQIDWEKGIYDYENAPAFQYSSNVTFDGWYIRYHGRNKESYQQKGMGVYQYGTEVTDLDYKKLIEILYKDLSNCKAKFK